MGSGRFGLFAAIVSLAWFGVGGVGESCCFAASLPVVDERIAEDERIVDNQDPETEDVIVIINKRALETDRVLPGAKLAMTRKSVNASGVTLQGLATAKFLSGPTVTRSANKLTWTSTTQELRLSLPVGTYAVDELEAPAGYLTTNMTFEVRADGKVYADLDADGAPEALPGNRVELKDTISVVKVTKEGSDSYHGSLAGGFETIGEGGTGTVTLLVDLALAGVGAVSVPDGCDITLDLAGKRIDWTTTNGDALFGFDDGTNGKLTITDSVSGGTVSAFCTSEDGKDAAIIVFCNGNGNLTVDGGTFVSSNKVGGATLFYKRGTGNWTFNGGTYLALGEGTGVADFLYCDAATGTTVIAGGKYDIKAEANSGRAVGASALSQERIVIGGGDFVVSSAGTWHGAFTPGNGSIVVTNGNFGVKGSGDGLSCFAAERNGTVVLSNGTFSAESTGGYVYAASASATGTLVVAGGTYSAKAGKDTAATVHAREAAKLTVVGSPAITLPAEAGWKRNVELRAGSLDFSGYAGALLDAFAAFADGLYGVPYVKGDMAKFSDASIWAGYFSTRPYDRTVMEGRRVFANTNELSKAAYPWVVDDTVSFVPPTLGNTTVHVHTNGVAMAEAASYTLRTNAANVKVVYTAESGYFFANGSTAVTNVLDTSKNPATAEAPAEPFVPVASVTTNGVTTLYGDIAEAWRGALKGTSENLATLKLLADVKLTDCLLAESPTFDGSNVAFDLNDHVLSPADGMEVSLIQFASECGSLKLFDAATTKTKKYFTAATGLPWALTNEATAHLVEGGVITGAKKAPAVWIAQGACEIRDVSFVGNHTDHNGAALFVNATPVNVYDTRFYGNVAAENGGALCGMPEGQFLLKGCDIRSNVAGENGGGIHMKNKCVLVDTTVSDNIAGMTGAGIHFEKDAECLAAGTMILMADGNGPEATDAQPAPKTVKSMMLGAMPLEPKLSDYGEEDLVLGKNAVVTNNFVGAITNGNIHLATADSLIALADDHTGLLAGVSRFEMPGQITTANDRTTAGDVAYLTSDSTNYVTRFSTGRYLRLALLSTVTATSVGNTTFTIYTNGVPVSGPSVIVTDDVSAKVVYRAFPGKYFPDGVTEVTNAFDTTVNPAEVKGALPAAPATPDVMVGKPAQRYPWNGIVDVPYRAKNAPAGSKVKFTVTVGGMDHDGDTVTLTTGGRVEDVHAIDFRKLGLEHERGKATVKASVVAE